MNYVRIWFLLFSAAISIYSLRLTANTALNLETQNTYRRFHIRDQEGKVLKIEPVESTSLPLWARDVSQDKFHWCVAHSEQPFFAEPIPFVVPPEKSKGEPFYPHNHCPSIAWLPNGDILAVWFSTVREQDIEMTILGARLRPGSEGWDEASEFFKADSRNMTGSSLFYDEATGIFHHFNSVGPENVEGWDKLALLHRISLDNGVRWSTAEPVSTGGNYQRRHQVISGLSRTPDGMLIQPCDSTPDGSGGTAIHLSRDSGKTWLDTGGNIRGIHAGVVGLKDGSLLAFGRGQNIEGRMPESRSVDGGKSWTYSPSPFPPIGGAQRLVLMRLREGPLLVVSFATGKPEMAFINRQGKTYIGSGMFAALSYDEGETWSVRKLLTPGKRVFRVGAYFGAKRRRPPVIKTTMVKAESEGYLAATQSPDGIIHLLSSRLHYRFNLKWLEISD